MKKDRYIKKVSDIFSSMGLTVLRGKIDYQSAKPDMIAIYDKINKYYVIEVVVDELFNNVADDSGVVGLIKDDRYHNFLREDILNNLSLGLKRVDDNALLQYHLDEKILYAAIISPERYARDIDRVLDYLDIEHKGLDIVDELHLQLISNENTKKLKNLESVALEY